MKTTTKKHWKNGHQIRGGWFHTINLSLGNYGIMISWGELPNGCRKDKLEINLFRFI